MSNKGFFLLKTIVEKCLISYTQPDFPKVDKKSRCAPRRTAQIRWVRGGHFLLSGHHHHKRLEPPVNKLIVWIMEEAFQNNQSHFRTENRKMVTEWIANRVSFPDKERGYQKLIKIVCTRYQKKDVKRMTAWLLRDWVAHTYLFHRWSGTGSGPPLAPANRKQRDKNRRTSEGTDESCNSSIRFRKVETSIKSHFNFWRRRRRRRFELQKKVRKSKKKYWEYFIAFHLTNKI